MEDIVIRTPIWATRSVGVAKDRIVDDLCIKISYTDKSGNKIYPHKYFIKRDKALSFPEQIVKGRTLKIIPIDQLNVMNEWGDIDKTFLA